MKKILIFLVGLSVIGTSTLSVVSCKKTKLNEDQPDPKPDPEIDHNPSNNHQLIEEFKQNIETIFLEHNKNIKTKLYDHEDFDFINRDKLKEYCGKMNELISNNNEDCKNFKKDLKKILEINKLRKNINDIKNNNKFDPILKGINEIFIDEEMVDFSKSNFEFASKSEGDETNFIGTIKISYTVKFRYKDNSDLKIDSINNRMLEYTFTKNKNFQDFQNSLENFQKNIEKDYSILEGKSNFNWENIRNNKEKYEGYGNFSSQIKEGKSNTFRDDLLNFIKDKYFNSLDAFDFIDKNNIKFEKIDFKKNFISVFENLTAKHFINLDKESSENMFKAIFRKTNNDDEINKTLKELYFTKENLKKWNEKFLDTKNEYLKDNGFSNDEINKIKKQNNYKNSVSIGKIDVTGLKITFKIGGYVYRHVLPNFKLNITYNISCDDDEKIDLLSKFTSKCLIKNFQEEFGIIDNSNYPNFNSNNDYLFNVNNKYKKILLDSKSVDALDKYPAAFVKLFRILNSRDDKERKKHIKKEINELINDEQKYYYLRENYENIVDYMDINDYGNYNSKISPKLKDDGIKVVPSDKGAKDKIANSITFKLGYLAVNIKYEKLFQLVNNKEKYFIKFDKD